MFQFGGFAFLAEYLIFNQVGCPIRKSSDQRLFAPSRSLSQLITSFIASESLGILHAPLFTSFMYYTVIGVLILICQYVNELFCIAATWIVSNFLPLSCGDAL